MDIKTQCKCGAILKANTELAGKQAKCPKCGDAVLIPKPDSIRLTCSCGQIIQAKASLAGKRVKCPTCSQPVDIPNTTSLPSPDVPGPAKVKKSPTLGNAPMPLPSTPETRFNNSVWDDLAKTVATAEKAEVVKHKPIEGSNQYAVSRQSNSLDNVQRGITFVYIGVLLNVAAVLSVVLIILLKADPLSIVCLLLSNASSLLSMIGRILCLTVPKQVGATALIYFAVGFDVTALLATVSGMILGMPNLSSISGLISVFATVLFLIFLRKLATYIKSDELVQRASEVLILCAGLVVFPVAGLVAISALGLIGMIFTMIFTLIEVVLLLLACIRYFQLLSDMRLNLGQK